MQTKVISMFNLGLHHSLSPDAGITMTMSLGLRKVEVNQSQKEPLRLSFRHDHQVKRSESIILNRITPGGVQNTRDAAKAAHPTLEKEALAP